MNARRGPRRLIEQRQGAREIEIGILRDQGRDAGDRLRNQNRAGLRVLHLRRVLGVGEKGELARPRAFHAGNAGDIEIGVASFNAATQRSGDIAKIHGRITNNNRVPATGRTHGYRTRGTGVQFRYTGGYKSASVAARSATPITSVSALVR